MNLINPLEAADKYVYHYTSLETALKYILPSGTIKFNSYQNVNDPRENKEWEVSAMLRSLPSPQREDYDKASLLVNQQLKYNTKLACFSMDRATAVGEWQTNGPINRGFAKPSLWHHYADKHKGVCLVFDRDKLHKAFVSQLGSEEGLGFGPVVYSDEGLIIDLGGHPYFINLTGAFNPDQFRRTIAGHQAVWFKRLYFHKLTDWSNESEYRWVLFSSSDTQSLFKFEDALQAIVLGEQVSREETVETEILRYCAHYRADIDRISWRNGYPVHDHPGQPYITHKHLLNGWSPQAK